MARPRLALACLLLVALAVRLPLLPSTGSRYDTGLYRQWTVTIHQHGLAEAFSHGFVDYTGYLYVLGLIGFLYGLVNPGFGVHDRTLHMLIKVPGVLGDLLVAGLLFWLTRRVVEDVLARQEAGPRSPAARLGPDGAALVAAGVYLFHPASVRLSAHWGQTDSLITAAMVAMAFAAWRGRTALAWFVLGLGFLVKPHPVVLAPLLGLVSVRQGLRSLVTGGLVAAGTVAAGLAYFVLTDNLRWLVKIYTYLFNPTQHISNNAWNVWWPAERLLHAKPQDTLLTLGGLEVAYREVASLLVLAALGVLVLAFRDRRPVTVLLCAAYLVFTFYMLPAGTLSRYLFPFFALMLPVVLLEPRWLAFYVPLSVTFFLNISSEVPPDWIGMRLRWNNWISFPLMAANVVLFLSFSAALLMRGRGAVAAAPVERVLDLLRAGKEEPGIPSSARRGGVSGNDG
ncbi:MAG TPA: glycosyltransferase 87 family protein [Dehalococcoidia bacterium]